MVFDFDGTLVAGDSFTGFCLRHCRRSALRFAVCLGVLPLVALLFLPLATRRFSARLFMWALTLGVSTRDIARALRAHSVERLSRRVDEAAFRELERWQAAGAEVVIATGTLPSLVRPLLDRRGLSGVRVIGSRLVRRFGGLVPEVHCIGPTKVAELERWIGARAWHWTYTDSAMDLPLMRCAGAVTLVGASPRTVRRVRRELAGDIPIHVWGEAEL